MRLFALAFVVSLVFSSVGFRKYVWFISIGYGFSVAAIGIAFLVAAHGQIDPACAAACVLFVLYGLRLGGYLALRELGSSSYKAKMKTEIKSGTDMPMVAKCSIWVSAALLYAAETAPVAFRITAHVGTDGFLIAGLIISVVGLVIETLADVQKNAAKKVNPRRFVDTGLYRIVRCPNYFGEMLFWTCVFVGGLPIYQGVVQWLVALLGYVGIIYVMFGGARRLELRQDRTYGADPAYQRYVRATPIMIPFVPLYSVKKYAWLVA